MGHWGTQNAFPLPRRYNQYGLEWWHCGGMGRGNTPQRQTAVSASLAGARQPLLVPGQESCQTKSRESHNVDPLTLMGISFHGRSCGERWVNQHNTHSHLTSVPPEKRFYTRLHLVETWKMKLFPNWIKNRYNNWTQTGINGKRWWLANLQWMPSH